MDIEKILSYFYKDLHNYSLQSILLLLGKLGNPHTRVAPLIHITGTNGKGSTGAFLVSCLKAAGYRVHHFLSPHLLNYTERIQLDGQAISLKTLIHYLKICVQTGISVSVFEALTAAAFLAFAEHPADIVVMEVGLGGRLDATNVSHTTCLSVFTPISLDHTETLGPTLVSIAREKSGIMRSHIPCVVAQQEEEVSSVLMTQAISLHSPVYQQGPQWDCFRQSERGISSSFMKSDPLPQDIRSEKGMTFLLKDHEAVTYPALGLVGDHQIINAGTAIAALKIQTHCPITDEDIAQGLLQASWPGRLCRLKSKDFPPESEIWVDGAHNEAGAKALAHHLTTYWQDGRQLILCLGILSSKDSRSFWQWLAPLADQICIIENFAQKSVTSRDIFRQYVPAYPFQAFSSLEEWASAFHFVDSSMRLLFCGSLYFVGEVIKMYASL